MCVDTDCPCPGFTDIEDDVEGNYAAVMQRHVRDSFYIAASSILREARFLTAKHPEYKSYIAEKAVQAIRWVYEERFPTIQNDVNDVLSNAEQEALIIYHSLDGRFSIAERMQIAIEMLSIIQANLSSGDYGGVL
jgi:hypothetical protein